MGKNQEERKTPIIVVKKRRTFSPPSLSEKTDIIAPVFTEQTAESAPAGINSSAVETHIPEAPARKWLCAVSCITSRRVYLQRTAVAGVPRYGLDGHPKGQVSDSEAQSAGRRLATLEQKLLRMQAQQENILGNKSDVVPALWAGAASLFSYEGWARCCIYVVFLFLMFFCCGLRTVRFRGPRVSVGGAFRF